MLYKKISLMLIIALFFSLGISSSFAKDEKIIKIGFGGALNGDLASYGLSGLRGLEYAIDQANANGGINGTKIEIVKEDDSCAPDMATNAATKLLSSGIKVIFGHTCSGATASALGVYGDQAILISPSATAVSLTESGQNPYFFRTTPRDDAQANLLADTIHASGFTKIALIHDKGDYGKGLIDLVQARFKANPTWGIDVVLLEGVTPGQVDYSAVVNKVKQKGAQAVVWGGYYPEASKIVNNMRRTKVKATFFGPEGVRDDAFIKILGKSAEGCFVSGPIDISKNPLAIAAIASFRKQYPGQEYGPFFLNGVSAGMAIVNAIQKVGNAQDIVALKKCLQSDLVDTPIGKTKFDAKGDAEGVGFSMYKVVNGKFVEYKK